MNIHRRQYLKISAAAIASAWSTGIPAVGDTDSWAGRNLDIPADEVQAVVTAAALSHSRRLATGGDDHRIRIWDLDQGKLERTLKGHQDWIRSVAFAGATEQLISAGHDRQVLAWQANGPERLAKLSSPVSMIRIDHEGRTAAAVEFGGLLHAFDVQARSLRYQVDCQCRDMRCVEFSPDGRTLAAGGRDGRLRVFDAQTGQSLFRAADAGRRIRALAYLDSARIVTGGDDGRLLLWRWEDRAPAVPVTRPLGRIFVMGRVSAETIAFAGSDNLVRIWNAEQQEIVSELTGHTGTIAAMCTGTDTIVTGGFDTTIRIWSKSENVAESNDPTNIRSARRNK